MAQEPFVKSPPTAAGAAEDQLAALAFDCCLGALDDMISVLPEDDDPAEPSATAAQSVARRLLTDAAPLVTPG